MGIMSTTQPPTKQIRIICGCCAGPLAAFPFSATADETIYGVIPCKCNGVPPVVPEKAQVILLDYHRSKRASRLATKTKR